MSCHSNQLNIELDMLQTSYFVSGRWWRLTVICSLDISMTLNQILNNILPAKTWDTIVLDLTLYLS